MIISTRNLSVSYNDRIAVKHVSSDFREGEVAALIGPSGCGKSSFIRALNRMNEFIDGAVTSGDVLFHGKNIYDNDVDPVSIRRLIGMVFQKPNPFPKSIFENIAWAPRSSGYPKNEIPQLVEESLKKAALWEEVKDRLSVSAFELSGGQQQRLCIARALAMNPEILLMDEPCSALDPIATAKIEELIHELKTSVTMIVVTHNMQQALRISNRTLFFLNGELLESGQTEKIFQEAEKSETRNYINGRFG